MKYLLLYVLLVTQSLYSICEDKYSSLKPLKMTLAKIKGKKEAFGKIIKSEKDLKLFMSSLGPHDDIIYLINRDKDLVLAPRFAATAEDKNVLVAHVSLYNILKKTSNTDIYASGEIIRRHGQVSSLNNKSGTFKGNDKNLKFALDILVEKSIVDKKVRLVDYSGERVPENHLEDSEMASNFNQIRSSKKQTELHEEILELVSLYYKRFPDQVKKGLLDEDAAVPMLERVYSEEGGDVFMSVQEALTYVSFILNDGIYHYAGLEKLLLVRDSLVYGLKYL